MQNNPNTHEHKPCFKKPTKGLLGPMRLCALLQKIQTPLMKFTRDARLSACGVRLESNFQPFS